MPETSDPTNAAPAGDVPPRGFAGRRRRLSARRFSFLCFKSLGALVILVAVGLGLVTARLSQGPLKLDGLGDKIASALDARFGRGARFTLGDTSLVQRGFGPSLTIDKLAISGPDGAPVLFAPKAEVAVDSFALLFGKVVPKRLEVFDVTLKLALLKNGHLALAAGDAAKPFFEIGGRDEGAAPAPEAALPAGTPSASRRAVVMREAGLALRQFMDVLTDPGSAIAAVDRLGISRGKLVIEDQVTEQVTTYKDLDLSFDRSHGKTSFAVAADGPSGRWSVAALAAGRPGASRSFNLEVKQLSIDELQLLTGSRSLGVETDMPVGLTLDIALKPDNDLSEAVGGFALGPGFLRPDDPDQEPIFISTLDGGFHWNAADRTIDIDSLRYVEGATHFKLAGKVVPPHSEGDAWSFGLALAEPGLLAPERKGQKPVAITSASVDGRLDLGKKTFFLDRFAVGAEPGGISFVGTVDWIDGPRIRMGARLIPTPVETVERGWPAAVASPVRAWLINRFESGMVTGGTLQIDYDKVALARMRADRAPPDSAVKLDFAVSKGKLRFLDGVPELDDIEGHVHITGRTTHFWLDSGSIDANGKKIAVSNGLFVVPNANVKPTPATLTAHLGGSVEAVTDVLTRDALKPYASIPLDPTTLHGEVDGELGKALMLGKGGSSAQTPLSVDAHISHFVADRLVGKEGLDNADVTIKVAEGALSAKGQGRIFGAPAQFEINRVGDGPPIALISATLDDAARAKVGLQAIPGVTGPMTAHVNASLGDPTKIKAQVDLDLTHTAIAAGLIGLTKPAGRAAKIDFTVQPGNDRMLIEPIAIDVASLQGRGGIELDGDNAFKSAHFSSLKISPGDDMKVDVGKADDGFKLTIRGSTIDARPFLKALTTTPVAEKGPQRGTKSALAKSAKAEASEVGSLGGFDVDLKSGILTGFNREVMSGVDLKLSKHGPQIRQFLVQGRFGGDSVSGSMDSNHRIRVMSRDAGALVSFVDLYKHMEGGNLSADMTMDGDTLDGNLEIHDFVLRDEPAIRSLVARSTTVSAPGQNEAAAKRINGDAVGFNRLKVNFERDGSRLELSDATMSGPEIGLSVDGWLDYSHNKVAMNGTFVPVFALNNLFSQIPVIGAVLGGKSNEGLLAITFKISGAAASPTLTINPLSAVTPGFLRSIFGNIDMPGMQIPADGEGEPASR